MSEKKVMYTVRNTLRKTIPLEGGEGTPSKTLAPCTMHTLGPEYHEHDHFKSLVKKGMLHVIRREEVKLKLVPSAPKEPPKEKPKEVETSSTPRQRRKKFGILKKAEGEESSSDEASDNAGKE